MDSKKSSKKSNQAIEVSVPLTEKTSVDSKPVKRLSPAKNKTVSSVAAKPSEPKNTTHRHSKLAVPHVTATPSAIDYDEVARLAYKFWEQRNFAHGFAEEDWHRAEKAISAKVG